MTDILAKLISEGVNAYLVSIVDSGVKIMVQLIGKMGDAGTDLLSLDIVTHAIAYTQSIAASLLVMKIVYEALVIYILRFQGSSHDHPGALLKDAIQSCAIIGCVPWLVRWVYQFGTATVADISALPGVDYHNSGSFITEMFTTNDLLTNSPLIMFVLFAFAILFAAILFTQSIIRSAELALIAIMGAIAAVGIRSNLFSMWWKSLLTVSLSQAIQILMIKISFSVLESSILSSDNTSKLLTFLAFLFLTVKSPSILRQYVHSTGLGRIAGGAAQQMISMALMRKMFRAG